MWRTELDILLKEALTLALQYKYYSVTGEPVCCNLMNRFTTGATWMEKWPYSAVRRCETDGRTEIVFFLFFSRLSAALSTRLEPVHHSSEMCVRALHSNIDHLLWERSSGLQYIQSSTYQIGVITDHILIYSREISFLKLEIVITAAPLPFVSK